MQSIGYKFSVDTWELPPQFLVVLVSLYVCSLFRGSVEPIIGKGLYTNGLFFMHMLGTGVFF